MSSAEKKLDSPSLPLTTKTVYAPLEGLLISGVQERLLLHRSRVPSSIIAVPSGSPAMLLGMQSRLIRVLCECRWIAATGRGWTTLAPLRLFVLPSRLPIKTAYLSKERTTRLHAAPHFLISFHLFLGRVSSPFMDRGFFSDKNHRTMESFFFFGARQIVCSRVRCAH